MDETVNYAIPGEFMEDRQIVVFKMQDAFKNTLNDLVPTEPM